MKSHPGDPGATSRDDTILSGESLLQELKSPRELILTEPEYFSAQSARNPKVFPQKIPLPKPCQMERALLKTLATILSLPSFTRPVKGIH